MVTVVDVAELLSRCDFPAAGTTVSCGLSGGPDSSALVALAVARELDVTAWHVNHALRPEAEADEAKARTIAAQLDAAFVTRAAPVEAGSGLEARARRARYEALPDDVLVGHTADDRAETILFNIGRGGGLVGASALHRAVRRPLLRLRRRETHALCRQLELDVATDAMNDDPRFARTVIRTDVVPALERALDRDPAPLLNRHADLVADASAVIDELAAAIDPTDVRALVAVPRAVASAALRAWLTTQLCVTGGVSSASIDRVLAVVHGECVATEIEGGHRVARTAARLRVEAPAPQTRR